MVEQSEFERGRRAGHLEVIGFLKEYAVTVAKKENRGPLAAFMTKAVGVPAVEGLAKVLELRFGS